MGTQQFLYTVAGILIVGIAIAIGVTMVSHSYTDRMSELLINKVQKIGLEANEYRKKPVSMGGGGGSYKGFDDRVRSILKDESLKKLIIISNKNKLMLRFELKGDSKKSPKVNVTYMQDGIDRLRYYDPNQRKWVWYIKKGDILEQKPKNPKKPLGPQKNNNSSSDIDLATIS